MSKFDWLRKILDRANKSSRGLNRPGGRAKSRCRYRLGFEKLEDRTLLDVGLTAGMQSAILSGFNELANGNTGSSWASQLSSLSILADNLPAISTSGGAADQLGNLLHINRVFGDTLYSPTNSYFTSNSATATAAGLASALSAVTAATYSDGTATYTDTIGYVAGSGVGSNNDLQLSVILNASTTFSQFLALGSQSAALGITLPALATPPALAGTVSLHFHFTVDLAPVTGQTDTFNYEMLVNTKDATDANPLQVGLSLNASSLGFGVNVGFLNASIVNGSVTATPSATASFSTADATTGIATLTLDNLENTPIGNLISLSGSGSFSATLPIAASLGSFSTPSGVNAPTLTLGSAGAFNSSVTASASNFSQLSNFTNVGSGQVLSELRSLGSFLEGYDSSAAFNIPIPFSTQTLGSVYDLGSAYDSQVLASLQTAVPAAPGSSATTTYAPNFTTIQDLMTAFEGELGLSANALAVNYDSANNVIDFTLNWNPTFGLSPVNLRFTTSYGQLGNINTTGQLTPTANLNFQTTLGISLDAQPPQLAGAIPPAGATVTGPVLKLELHPDRDHLERLDPFSAISIAASSTSGYTLDQLVSAINTAIGSSALNGYVIAENPSYAGSASNRLVFTSPSSPTAALQSIEIQCAANDPMVTQFLFSLNAQGTGDQTAYATANQLYLSTSTALTGTVSLNASSFSASANYGYIQMTAGGDAHVAVTANVGFQNPSTPGAATVALSTLVSGLSAPSTILSGTLSPTASFDFTTVAISGLSSLAAIIPNNLAVHVSLPTAGVSLGTGSAVEPNVNLAMQDTNGVLSADARFQVTLGGNGPVTVTIPASSTAGNVSLGQLAAQVQTAVNTALSAAGFTDTVTASVNGSAVELSPATAGEALTVSNFYEMSLPNFGSLTNLSELNFSTILGAVSSAVSTLSAADDASFATGYLNAALPLINESVRDILDLVDNTATDVQALGNNPASALQSVNRVIDSAFGLPLSTQVLSWDAANTALKIAFSYTISNGPNGTMLPLNLDLASLVSILQSQNPSSPAIAELVGVTNLVDAAGGGDLQVKAGATIQADIGIDLSNPLDPLPFLYSSSGVAVSLGITTPTPLSLSVQVGPISVQLQNGVLTLGQSSVNTSSPATLTLGMTPVASGKYYLNAPLTSDFAMAVSGYAQASASVFLAGTNLGTLSVTINSLADVLNPALGVANAVQITAPNLAQNLNGGSLDVMLANQAIVIGGLEKSLNTLQGEMNSVAGNSLPIIGSGLSTVAHFISGATGFAKGLLTQLTNAIKNGGSNIELSYANGIYDSLGNGSGGLNLLVNTYDAATQTWSWVGNASAITANKTASNLEFDLHLHGSYTVTTGLNFNLGLPGFDFSLNAAPVLTFTWDLYLGFGVDLVNGFYVQTTPKNPDGTQATYNGSPLSTPLVLHVGVALVQTSGATSIAMGQLGVLTVAASQLAVPTPPPPAAFNANIGVGFANPPPSGEMTMAIISATQLKTLFTASIVGTATVDLHLTAGPTAFSGTVGSAISAITAAIPAISTDLHVEWDFTTGGNGLAGSQPTVQLNNVSMNLGAYFQYFVEPILSTVTNFINPIKPVIDLLNTPLPVISQLAGHDITLVDLAVLTGGITSAAAGDDNTILSDIEDLYSLLSGISAVENSSITINFGSFDLSGTDLRSSSADLPATPDYLGSAPTDPMTQISNGGSTTTTSFANGLRKTGPFEMEFTLLSTGAPIAVYDMLVGKPANLFTARFSPIDVGVGYTDFFPIAGPLGVRIVANLQAYLSASFGYDTYGLLEFNKDTKSTGNYAAHVKDFLDGFYVGTNGATQISLTGTITAGAELDLGIASGGVDANIVLTVAGSVADPEQTGKLRWRDAWAVINLDGGLPLGVLGLFDIKGELTFSLSAWVKVLTFTVYSGDIVSPITIVDFNSLPFMPTPILATQDPTTGILTLNMGPNAADRGFDSSDGSTDMTVRHVSGPANDETVTVSAVLPDGLTVAAQTYTGVTGVSADGGDVGDNVIDLTGVLAPATLNGGTGGDEVIGSDGGDVITDQGAGSTLTGGAGNDTLTGVGNDTIEGGGGINLMTGGPGLNTLIGDSGSTNTVLETGGTNWILTDSGLSWDGYSDTFQGTIQNADLVGSDGGDSFDISGWDMPGNSVTLAGGAGNNTVSADNTELALVNANEDPNFVLTDSSLTRSPLANGPSSATLVNIGTANLAGNLGGNTFDISGWSGTGSLTGGLGSNNTVIATNDANFTLTNSALDRTGTGTMDLSGIQVADLTAGPGVDHFTVTNFLGTANLNSGGPNDQDGLTLQMTGGTVNAGPYTLVLDTDVISNAANNTATVTGSLDLDGGTRTFTVAQGTTANGDDMVVSAVLSDGAVTKQGPGRLVFGGINTYAGLTTIAAGTLSAAANDALGTTAGQTIVDSGASLGFQGNANYTDAENVTVYGDGVGSGGAIVNIRDINTFAGNIVMQTNGTFGSDTGSLTLDGSLNRGTYNLSFTGAGTLVIPILVAGPGTITQNGNGLTIFSHKNTYTGQTTINNGVLEVEANNALGVNPPTPIVNNGGTLGFGGGFAYSTMQPVIINGPGYLGIGAISNISGNNSFTGPITLASASTIGSLAGTLTLTGNIYNQGFLLTVNGPGNITANDVISGSGGLTVNDTGTGTVILGSFPVSDAGTGTLILSGSLSNTYKGTTNVNSGTVKLEKTAGASAIPGPLVVGDGIGALNSAIVRMVGAGNQLAVVPPDSSAHLPVTVNSDGLFDLNGFNQVINTLTMNGGDITTGAGTLTLTNNVNATSVNTTGLTPNVASAALISGHLDLGGSVDRVFNIAPGTAPYDMIISAVVSDGGILKLGLGSLELSGSNVYNGTTAIQTGTLVAGSNNALGTTQGNTTVNTGATLGFLGGINYTTPESVTINGAGVGGNGAIDNLGGNNTFFGPITLAGPSTIGSLNLATTLSLTDGITTGTLSTVTDTLTFAGAGNVTVNSVITGNGIVVMNGTGTLTFAGGQGNIYPLSSTYPGTTYVNSGTLVLDKTAGLAIPAGLVIGDGIGAPDSAVVTLLAANQISSTANITINSDGELNLNGFTNTLGSVALNGGTLLTGGGSTILNSDLTISTSSIITANITLPTTRTLTFMGGATLTINGTISGPGGLTENGTGTLVLAGTGANTYFGTTTVMNGTLVLNKAAGVNALTGPLVIGDGFGPADTAIVRLNAGQQIPSTITVTILKDGLLDLNGKADTIGPINFQGGQVTTEAGVLTLGANVTGDFETASIIGNVVLPATRTFTVALDGIITVNGPISGAGGLVKSGQGSLILAGSTANSYASSTSVTDGILLLNKNPGMDAIPAGTLTIGDAVGTAKSAVVRLLAANQINDGTAITVNSDGLLDLNGHADQVGMLTLNTGCVTTGAGSLSLGAGVADSGTSAISGNVVLVVNNNVNVNAGGILTISGPISGNGGLNKTGTGTLVLTGTTANSYHGATTVLGTLTLNKSTGIVAIPGALTIGTATGTAGSDVVLMALAGQLPSTSQVTINATGLLDLNGTPQTVGSLIMAGGSLLTRANGLLTLNGNVVATTSSTIGGSVALGGVTRTFTVSAGATLTVNGQITGTGGLTLAGSGTLVMSGGSDNLYTGLTTVAGSTLIANKAAGYLAIPGALTIGDGVGMPASAVVQLAASNEIATAGLSIMSDGLLNLNNFSNQVGSLSLSGGSITTGTGLLTLTTDVAVPSGSSMISGNLSLKDATRNFTVAANASINISAVITSISGAGLNLSGAGIMTLSGNNTYTGATKVKGGTLYINGNQAAGSVYVLTGAVLGGTGITGGITLTGGTLGQGATLGTLNANGNVSFDSASTDVVKLTSSGNDVLNVTGSASLNNSTLSLSLNFTPTSGQQFTILQTTGGVTGTFAGLAEGATITIGSVKFTITYKGGPSGKNVVLTAV